MIYRLVPNIQRKIWGGKNLEHLKNIPVEMGVDPVGETWEISIHPDGPSFFQGSKFTIDETTEELPYLVKLLDTSDVLSVQVHPGDEYAKLHENSRGKTECWVILKAEHGSGIYLGMKEGVTKDSFMEGLNQKRNMSEFLNFYPVAPGDFFYVPAGTIHAIGKGILMAEVQQSSGVTYRVWDWDRLDSKGNPRDLHVKKSLDVLNFNPEANVKSYFKVMHDLFSQNGKKEIIEHSTFKMSLVNLAKDQSIQIPLAQQKRMRSILNFQGELSINGESVEKYSAVVFRNETSLNVRALSVTSFLFLE